MYHDNHPISTTLNLIGGKWKVLIIHHLSARTKRFGELRRDMPNITQRMLTMQLRELEQDGIVQRTVYPVVPPKVEYSLTKFGCSLQPVIDSIYHWGEAHPKGVQL